MDVEYINLDGKMGIGHTVLYRWMCPIQTRPTQMTQTHQTHQNQTHQTQMTPTHQVQTNRGGMFHLGCIGINERS